MKTYFAHVTMKIALPDDKDPFKELSKTAPYELSREIVSIKEVEKNAR